MPKGLDAELLSKLMEITPEIAEAYLRELERFSFIKQRYDEHQKRKTYYLHDEFYAMLKLAAFSASPSGWNEKQIIYKQVIQAYEDRFKHIRGKLRDSYKSMQTGGENQIDWKELNRLISLRSEVLLALLYYRLRQDPPKGFRRWVRFDHEAVIGGDLSFSIQLQLELTTYVRERASEAETQKDGWDTALVRWALLLRPIKHAWATGKSQEVVLMAEETQKHDGEELEDSIKLAMLLVWKAYALAYWDTPSAHNEINVVINALENYSTQEDIRAWLRQMLLAYSYRIRGYCYRVQDRTEDAILNYRQASVLLREVDLKIEIATVNNDLGFALMLIGYSSDARSLAGNALELRSELGLGSQVAFSLNTIALIDLYESRYKEAIENATKALNIFRAVSSKRGIGMALVALAEATRRHSSDLPGATVQVRLDMLTRAYEYADEAYAIFHENGEVSRQVEALIEKGCARRDAVRLVQEAPMVSFSKERFIRESQNFLQQAGKLATTLVKAPQIHNRQIDALVNLAWLGFYAGEEAGEAIRQEAEDEVERLLTEYQLAEGSARPKIYGKPDYQPLLSTQLGKLHVLRGHRIYKNHEAPEEENNLWKARFEILEQASLEVQAVYRSLAQEYFLGLEHGALYSSEYRDLRLAKQQIFDHLKGLRSEKLQLFMEYVTELETTYQIAMPPGSQLRQLLVNRALWMEDVKSM